MTSQQHTADAAGGEAIYSSDALPPLPIPPPPPSITKHTPEDVIDFDGHGDGKHYTQWSALSISASSSETREEKLERIARELKEMEVKDGEEDVLSSKVEDLKQKLNQMSYRNLLSRRLESSLSPTDANANADGTANEIASVSAPAPSNAEARLLQIEKILGSDGGTVASTPISILERLKVAEEQLKTVDEKTLTVAASRAKVIRADLEAAAKARSKLSSSSSNSAQDTNKISKLYTQLIDLDGFLTGTMSSTMGSSTGTSDTSGVSVGVGATNNDVLATIVNRLTSCAELHARSSHFGNDLNALEGMMGDVKVLLTSLEETVGKLENGMEENMKVIKDNMEELDKRLG